MSKIANKTKENPKLQELELADGRISLYLEYYLGREEIPVLDTNGNKVYYETGKMAGKPKITVKHNRKKEWIIKMFYGYKKTESQLKLKHRFCTQSRYTPG